MPLLAILFVGVGGSLLLLSEVWAYGIAIILLLVLPAVALGLHWGFGSRRTWLRRWWYRVTVVPVTVLALFGWFLGIVPDNAPAWLQNGADAMLHQWHVSRAVQGTWITEWQHRAVAIGSRPAHAWLASFALIGLLIALEVVLDTVDAIARAALHGGGFDSVKAPTVGKTGVVPPGKAGVTDGLSA